MGVTENKSVRAPWGLPTLRRRGHHQLSIASWGIRTTAQGQHLKTSFKRNFPLIEYVQNMFSQLVPWKTQLLFLYRLFSQQSIIWEKAQEAFEVGCVSLGGLDFSGWPIFAYPSSGSNLASIKLLPCCSLTRRNARGAFRCFQELCHCNGADLWSCFYSSNLVQFAQRSGGRSLYNARITRGPQTRRKEWGITATTSASSFLPSSRIRDRRDSKHGFWRGCQPRRVFSFCSRLYPGWRQSVLTQCLLVVHHLRSLGRQ